MHGKDHSKAYASEVKLISISILSFVVAHPDLELHQMHKIAAFSDENTVFLCREVEENIFT